MCLPRHWARRLYRHGLAASLLAVLLPLAVAATEPGAATVVTPPRPLAGLDLIDHRDRPLNTASLSGKWTVMFFGFTHCPDVCPTTLARLAGIQRQLPAAARDRVRFVLVSVDPMRDTSQRLAEYVGQFGQDFVGATAPLGQLGPLLRELGVSYAYTAQADDEHAAHASHGAPAYTVAHSDHLYVLDPQARFYAVFTRPDDYQVLRALSTWAGESGAGQ